MSLWDQILGMARRKSPWFYVLNSGSCNGCDIEIGATLCPRYDPEQIGALRQGSPKHADILLVTGPITLRTQRALVDIYEQMPFPKVVVAVGSCPASGNVFSGSPTVAAPLDQTIPVDIYVPGCPPRPQDILQGIIQASALLQRHTVEKEA
jgi:membrane-bound hydrogenase subunit mbhJ